MICVKNTRLVFRYEISVLFLVVSSVQSVTTVPTLTLDAFPHRVLVLCVPINGIINCVLIFIRSRFCGISVAYISHFISMCCVSVNVREYHLCISFNSHSYQIA